jgi:hypothetical protein
MSVIIIPQKSYIVYSNIGESHEMNKKWTPQAIEYLIGYYHQYEDDVLAVELTKFLGYTPTTYSVAKKRTRLKLKRRKGRPNKVFTKTEFIDANLLN